MSLRWLQWSHLDLAHGQGGVENHARCLAREFTGMGIENKISSDPKDLGDSRWNVLHAHGSAPLVWDRVATRMRSEHPPQIVHTLHGTTLGRMAACRELFWVGGYLAALREIESVRRAHVVLAVHGDLHLFKLAKKWGKTTAVCSNGWDSGLTAESLATALQESLPSAYWLYIGRGQDRVKGADRIARASQLLPDLRWVVVPGDGFLDNPVLVKAGPQTPGQIQTLIQGASGLALCSRYEGLPLVVLEALAQGLPVVATRVGGLQSLPADLKGLLWSSSGDARAIADAIRGASRFLKADRLGRSRHNQSLLPTWRRVAESAVQTVKNSLTGRKTW